MDFKRLAFEFDARTLNLGKVKVLEVIEESTPWNMTFNPWKYGTYYPGKVSPDEIERMLRNRLIIEEGYDLKGRKFRWALNTFVFPSATLLVLTSIFWMILGRLPFDYACPDPPFIRCAVVLWVIWFLLSVNAFFEEILGST